MQYNQWVSDIEAVEEEQRIALIRFSLRKKENLHIFGKYFFPHIIEGLEDVPECHIDLIRELSTPNDSGIIFPRGFAKSTWEKIDTIHDIVYQLEPVILYISAVLKDAQFHFESIKGELENNVLLRAVYGDVVPSEKNKSRKWTNTHFETTTGINLIARSRNKGRGINIKNRRPTKAIGDDLEDDEEVQNVDQREKLHNWLYNVIFPSLDPVRGRFKMIGTVLHTKAEVLDFYNKNGGIFRQAIEKGQSIWPSRFSLEWLEQKRKKIGSRSFNQEYQNNPVASDLAKIDPKWIDDRIYTVLPNNPMNKIIYIDPQAGESGMADEYAITCLGWFPKDVHRYVLEQVAGRATQLEQAKEIVRMWLRHNKRVIVVAVEKVLNQTAVYQVLIDWKVGRIDFNTKEMTLGHPDWIDETDRNIPILGVQPRGKDGGKLKDKVARLEMHEASFERGEIHFRPEMTELKEQVCFLGTKAIDHDDRADSLVGALDLSYKNVSADITDEVISEKSKEEYNSTVAGNLYQKRF